MAKVIDLRKLKIYDIQRIFHWVFDLSKRPSFLPLKAKDRPSTINVVKLKTVATDMSNFLSSEFKVTCKVRINESIPFSMLLDCLLRDGNYENLVASLAYIKMENLEFIPMVKFEKLYPSEIFVDSEISLGKNDFSNYKMANGVSKHSIIALDVEKVETEAGKELGRVTIVDSKGESIYDKIIKPKNPVLNYLTKYSGLTKELVDKGTDVKLVRNEILNLIGSNTVLVGHGVENDLSSLELYHNNIIDTAHLFLNPEGRKLSLAQLSKTHLGKVIHTDTHDSKIDAITCLELLSIKIQHMINITNKDSPRIRVEAEIANTHIMDLLRSKAGGLNFTTCSYNELQEFSRYYKKDKECLWMFIYEVSEKIYLSF